MITRTLYLCKDVETFGSGLRKIYTLCDEAGVAITYQNRDTDFTFEFSRGDRNKTPDAENLAGTITETESEILSWLKTDPDMTAAKLAEKSGKSLRTINRSLALLKSRGLLWRVGSNKTGHWGMK